MTAQEERKEVFQRLNQLEVSVGKLEESEMWIKESLRAIKKLIYTVMGGVILSIAVRFIKI